MPARQRGSTMPARRCLLADLWALFGEDWRNITAGIYAAPEDWHANPVAELRRAIDFFTDLGAVESRRHGPRGGHLPAAVPAGRYPRYYLQNFHFQSDGYLSEASAERYDHQVEVLFGGGAAVMRRQALVPLRAALLSRPGAAGAAKLLDIGCGTGTFLGEVKRNYPRLSVTGLDLSAPYLAVARRRLARWSRVEWIEAAAEAMPFAGGEFDIVTSIYLFHELPPRTRRTVAAEIRRILKPGGWLVFVDSLQSGDVPDYDALLEYFPLAFHEPYYASYLGEDLHRVTRPGLEPVGRRLAYFSKILAYRRQGSPVNHNM